jgi:hypothetical protein
VSTVIITVTNVTQEEAAGGGPLYGLFNGSCPV